MIKVPDGNYPEPREIHAQILNDMRYAYDQMGIEANVKKGSDLWYRALAVANRLSVAIANGQLALKSVNPLLAVGNDLLAIADAFGVESPVPERSVGYVRIKVTFTGATVAIPLHFQCTSAEGIKYRVTVADIYGNGDPVPVESVDTGTGTILDEGEQVTWDSAALAYLHPKATVSDGGITGGLNPIDDDTLRARLLAKWRAAAVGGNPGHVIMLSEKASLAVKNAYIYPAVRGPGSLDVALMGDGEDAVLTTAVVNSVAAKVVEDMPGSMSYNFTSVNLEYVDGVINLALPVPVHGGGYAGGWYQVQPWPSTQDIGALAEITLLTPPNIITVDSTVADPPYDGCRFCIYNPATQQMQEFLAVAVAGAPGAYEITLDVPTTPDWVTTGMRCSAAAIHSNDYAEEVYKQFLELKPGQKTDNPDILIYGRRLPSAAYGTISVTNRLLLNLIKNFRWVEDAAWEAIYATGTVVPLVTPSIPLAVANPPNVLRLHNLSFRAIL